MGKFLPAVLVVSLLFITGCSVDTPFDTDDKEKVKTFVDTIRRTQVEQTNALETISATLTELVELNKQDLVEVCEWVGRPIPDVEQ